MPQALVEDGIFVV